MNTNTNAALAQRLRDACSSVRIKSYPLSDLIPLMQQAADTLSTAAQTPAGWVSLTIEHEKGYPEEVAYGPKIMMDRLKKWLDRYFSMIAAAPKAAKAEPVQQPDLQARIAELEANLKRATSALQQPERVPLTDKQCDSIIANLDQVGRDIDRYEYGLPLAHDEAVRERMRSAVRDGAAHGIQPAPIKTQQRPPNCGTGYCSCIECVMDEPAHKEQTDES